MKKSKTIAFCHLNQDYEGYAVFGENKKPIGIISSNADRKAICNSIPNKLKKSLISIEDQRFYKHGAIDIKAVTRAFYENAKAGKIVQGGSTITQQLARNILRNNKRTLGRKLNEINLAIKLEKKHNKDEILDLYFNNVFWGRKNYGLRTASLTYFEKEPEKLSISEQIALLTFLRGPNFYLNNPIHFKLRFNLIHEILRRENILTKKNISKIKKTKININNNTLEVFKSSTIPYISQNIINETHSIISTIDINLQRDVTKFISNSQYPTSVICLNKGKVIAVGSSNGSDYPFTYKSNVGSTLKPFIYAFLRANGVEKNELFKTNINTLNWEIREAVKSNQGYISLKDALKSSNNNAFVDAAEKVGISKTLLFLSEITKKPINDFVPASILGATINGISLYELLSTYERFFFAQKINAIQKESLEILNEIAKQKFNGEFENSFLKTGTTNDNKERFAVVKYSNLLFGFLRQGNPLDDYSKEGGFLNNILSFLRMISQKKYEWDN